MAAAAISTITQFDEINRAITARNLAPVYLLHGDEGYFIDVLMRRFEEVIDPADRDFNLYTFYAPDTEPDTVIDACRRYPMMSPLQMVIVKEAQTQPARWVERLKVYTEAVTPTTVLVVASRGEKCKSAAFTKAVTSARGVVFESSRLKEKEAGSVIAKFISSKGLNIEPKGLMMLRDYVGSDLSRLYNEIEKLTLALPNGAMITPAVIESHIGISKDYNNFELIGALASRNAPRALTIVEHFRSDPKNNPFVVTVSTVFNFFSNLLVLLYSRDKSEAGLCAAIGRKGSWLPADYKDGMRNYNAWQLISILRAIRTADARSKGVDSRMDPYDLLRDMTFRILTTTGR